MIDVAARSVAVEFMVQDHPVGDWVIDSFPCVSVGINYFSIRPNLPVSMMSFCPRPDEAVTLPLSAGGERLFWGCEPTPTFEWIAVTLPSCIMSAAPAAGFDSIFASFN